MKSVKRYLGGMFLLLGVCMLSACQKNNNFTVSFEQEGQETIAVSVAAGEMLTDIPEVVQISANNMVTEWNMKEDLVVNENMTIRPTSYTDGLQFTQFKLKGKNVYSVSGYTGTGAVVTVPENYKGLQVVKIDPKVFYGNTTIIDVLLPDCIVEIGEDAFRKCTNLKKINIPSNVETFGTYAFENSGISGEITIPGSVKEVVERTFYYTKIDSVVFEEGVTTLGEFSFGDRQNLNTIVWPKSLTEVNGLAFWYQPVENIFFCGDEADWDMVHIGEEDYNKLGAREYMLKRATIYYYSETEPTTEGNFWHYVDGKVTVWGA